VQSRQP
ncbi:hypothetical protein S40285_07963, partial [Stachybotrys chlorohalonatus IBT 40285]